MRKYFKSRYGLLLSIVVIYLVISLLVRFMLLVLSHKDMDMSIVPVLEVIGIGFCFDVAVSLFFVAFYNFYLLLFPTSFVGSFLDKFLTYFILVIVLFLMLFGSMAEFPFWDEFGSRFNFIAVDYLFYTYEVVKNIHESYPLPLLIGGLLLLIVLCIYFLQKAGIFKAVFTDKAAFAKRLAYFLSILVPTVAFAFFLSNKEAEFGKDRTANELAKNGIFSFFAAFRSNELDYNTFYRTLPVGKVYSILRNDLLQQNQEYVSPDPENIERITEGNHQPEVHPNIFLITIESFSAEFLAEFGNKDNLTPNYDSISKQSVFFTNMYATGTRTVRGMEALMLSVPPTPGNSIVRRPDNASLFSIASVLKEKNYQLAFIYGGDGYFDNMNAFFGGQGFDIMDRDRGNPIPETIETHRYRIPDNEVSFENAWGICDEDIYSQSIKLADKEAARKRPFFQFIMTTSNHRPYTFPGGKIDMMQGTRESAVRYTDYALGKFLQEAKSKPWFRNSVFVIVADHCASSAGKWEINVSKHHIPAVIANLNRSVKIDRLTSQIDLIPTLFGYLGWQYHSSLYGKDINQTRVGDERAFIGNYRTLGILNDSTFTQLNDRKEVRQFVWNKANDNLDEVKRDRNQKLIDQAIAYYQSASERFSSGKMKSVKPASKK